MMGSMLRRGAISGGNLGPNLYGDTRANEFMRNLSTGAESLDIIIVGDSNTGSAVSGFWGYHNGFSEALNARSYQMYGTSYAHTMTDWLVDTNTGGWRGGYAYVKQPNGSLKNGNIDGGATAYAAWSPGKRATVTISNASPGVITYTAHGLTAGAPVFLATTGSLPTGLTVGFTYYVKTVLTADTFTVASTPTGSAINTSSAGSGTHTINTCPWIRYGSASATPPAKDGWAHLDAGSAEYWTWYPQLYIGTNHPLFGNSLTLYHRIRYGTFSSGSGYFRAAVRNFGGSTIATHSKVDTNNGNANSFAMTEYSFTSGGSNQLEASWCAGGSTAGSRGAVGPVAIHGHSLYAQRKGWAVHSHGYLAGYDSSTIQQVITGIKQAALKPHLQEIYERQVAAGGKGHVLIVAHSGINGADTSATWAAAHQAIWDEYKTAWTALGYDINKLAMLSFVGVQRNSADTSNGGANLATIRARAREWAYDNAGVTVADMPSVITYAELIGPPYLYQSGSTGDVHLSGGTGSTTDGYREVADRLIGALIA